MFLILGAMPFVSAVPEVDDGIYWYQLEDEEGDEPDNCERFNDLSRPTPCDIISFELGNTDTHLMARLTLATVEFGNTGQFGYVNHELSLRGNAGEDDSFIIKSQLTDGNVELLETTPQGWEVELELDAGADQILYAIPLPLLEAVMLDGHVAPHVSWINITKVASEWELVTDVDGIKGGDHIDDVTEDPPFVLQTHAGFETPEVEPVVFRENVTGDPLQVTHVFETGPVSMADPCVPWNQTCFMAAQPVTAHYVYNWTMDLTSVDFSFTTDIVNGSGATFITDSAGQEILFTPLTAGEDIEELLRPVEPGTWSFRVELDRFEGSFDLLAEEGPPLEDGAGDGGGGSHGGNTGNGDGSGDGNSTDPGDLEESGGIPGPGIVVVLVLVAGILRLTRRR